MPRRYQPPARRNKAKKRSPARTLAPPEREGEVAAPAVVMPAAPPVPHDEGRHITRDFSYVRTEMWRIAAVGGFITVSLFLTAIFLR
ncbi:MAG: hypothetical protein V3S00_00195 [Dehalococcoidia bacterium]